MDIRDVKKNLNREVLHDGHRYLFVGCILRRHRKESKFYYEAELHDTGNGNWVVYCPLWEIKEVHDESTP